MIDVCENMSVHMGAGVVYVDVDVVDVDELVDWVYGFGMNYNIVVDYLLHKVYVY